MSQWVSGFSGLFVFISALQWLPINCMYKLTDNDLFCSEDMSSSGNELLDQSSEGWVASCFNDSQMHLSPEDMYVISFCIRTSVFF